MPGSICPLPPHLFFWGGKPLGAVNAINKPSSESPPHPVYASRRKQTVSKAPTLLCSRWETLAWKPQAKGLAGSGAGRWWWAREAPRPLHPGLRLARASGGQRALTRGCFFPAACWKGAGNFSIYLAGRKYVHSPSLCTNIYPQIPSLRGGCDDRTVTQTPRPCQCSASVGGKGGGIGG